MREPYETRRFPPMPVRPSGQKGGDHGASVLQRRPADLHEGRRGARGPRGDERAPPTVAMPRPQPDPGGKI